MISLFLTLQQKYHLHTKHPQNTYPPHTQANLPFTQASAALGWLSAA
ncbi:MAG: hypothetical protein IT256_06245 [Chitinophagaceae bacterium]|nr:hypothetical protein [Chitinophagaceae bacterium]